MLIFRKRKMFCVSIFLILILNSQTIVEEKEKGDLEPKPLRFLQKIEKPIPRPPTPTVDVPSEVVKLAQCISIQENDYQYSSLTIN